MTVSEPNFVGSYDIGSHVFFFFRETAVEYINCGKSVYSRVARVCKRDTGGKNILSQNWSTYLKARLNCSIPGEFPFYFNEIRKSNRIKISKSRFFNNRIFISILFFFLISQYLISLLRISAFERQMSVRPFSESIYKVPGDDTHFYGTFTTSTNGLMGSAICSFHIDAIQEAFRGKFKEQATSSSAWLPVLSNKVPEPRPGQCVNDTETFPDTVLNFIRSHPLMDSAISHENEKPVFYKRDVMLTRLVVDKLRIDFVGLDLDYTVYYAGSSKLS